MRTIVINTQNTLLSGALMKYIRERGDMMPERVVNPIMGDEILNACKALKPDILFMEVAQAQPFTYDKRMDVIRDVRKIMPNCRIALMCDENANPELAEKVMSAKKHNIVDYFFYTSVSGEYLAAALEAM